MWDQLSGTECRSKSVAGRVWDQLSGAEARSKSAAGRVWDQLSGAEARSKSAGGRVWDQLAEAETGGGSLLQVECGTSWLCLSGDQEIRETTTNGH